MLFKCSVYGKYFSFEKCDTLFSEHRTLSVMTFQDVTYLSPRAGRSYDPHDSGKGLSRKKLPDLTSSPNSFFQSCFYLVTGALRPIIGFSGIRVDTVFNTSHL